MLWELEAEPRAVYSDFLFKNIKGLFLAWLTRRPEGKLQTACQMNFHQRYGQFQRLMPGGRGPRLEARERVIQPGPRAPSEQDRESQQQLLLDTWREPGQADADVMFSYSVDLYLLYLCSDNGLNLQVVQACVFPPVHTCVCASVHLCVCATAQSELSLRTV